MLQACLVSADAAAAGRAAAARRGNPNGDLSTVAPLGAKVEAAQSSACDTNPKAANLNFVLKDADGKDFNLASQKGKVILLDFWATWCPPLQGRDSVVRRVSAEIRSEGLHRHRRVGGRSRGERSSRSGSSIKVNYPLLVGEGGDDIKGPRGYNAAWGLPKTFVIGRDGKICKTHIGFVRQRTFRAADQIALVVSSERQCRKGFTHARLACGCRVAFREGLDGSPYTVVVADKAPGLPDHISTSAICRSTITAKRCVRRPASAPPSTRTSKKRTRNPTLSSARNGRWSEAISDLRVRGISTPAISTSPFVVDVIQVQQGKKAWVRPLAPQVHAEVDRFELVSSAPRWPARRSIR